MFLSQSKTSCLNSESTVHEFSNKKLHPELKFSSFYKKKVRSEIGNVVSYRQDITEVMKISHCILVRVTLIIASQN